MRPKDARGHLPNFWAMSRRGITGFVHRCIVHRSEPLAVPALVHELYGMTEEEMRIVEGGLR
jgi:hypothetical protein